MHRHTAWHICEGQRATCRNLFTSFYHVGSRDEVQVVRSGQNAPYLLSHPAHPIPASPYLSEVEPTPHHLTRHSHTRKHKYCATI